jgi:ADP-L-glycero-D-manno-heptose 6-epimerase
MIILTGGAGFIGSCFLKKLNDKGISNILVVDRLGKGTKWKNLLNKSFNQFIHKEEFREKLNNGFYDQIDIDAIIHLGACSSTTEKDADYLFDNNLSYSIELAEFADRFNIRFIYASSAATYGDGSKGYSDKKFDSLEPMNCYGFTKHLFDKWVIDQELADTFTGLKFFNVFGPNEYHKESMASMAYKSWKQIKDTGMVKLFRSNHSEYKDGEQKRDFLYIKDTVEIMWKILENKSIKGIFNLGTGNSRSWNDLAYSVFKALNIEPRIEYVDMPDYLIGQYQNFTEAEMLKLKETGLDLNFMSLEESVDDYVNNHLENNQFIW